MARNREFDDALDELKILHDAKNHDYPTAENPYKNLEGVARIGIEPWHGIVIRLMDKFERVQQYCTNGELAIKSEGMEDTFKDIAVYSTLAMILFRKGQEKDQELEDMIKNPESEESRFILRKHLEPVDEKYNGDESFTHPIIAMREAAEKQQEEEEIANHKKGFQSEIEKLEEERKANKYNKLFV